MNQSPAEHEPVGWCRCGYRVDPGVCPECGRDNPRPLKHNPRHWLRRMLRRSLWLLPVAALLGGVWLARDELALRFMPLEALQWVDKHIDLRKSGRNGIEFSWARHIMQLRAIRLRKALEPDVFPRFIQPAAGKPPAPGTQEYVHPYLEKRLIIRGSEFIYIAAASWGGKPLEWNYGKLERGPYRMRLIPEVDTRLMGFDCPTDFLIVTWGPSTTLVPNDPSSITDFFAELNSTYPQPTGGGAFWDRAIPGWNDLPVVPPELEQRVMKGPVELVLTSLEIQTDPRLHTKKVVATFEHAGQTRVPQGVMLYPVRLPNDDPSLDWLFTVVFSDESECLAEGWPVREKKLPAVGDRYFAGPKFRRAASQPANTAPASRDTRDVGE